MRHRVLVAHLEGDVGGQPFPLIEDGFQAGLVLAVNQPELAAGLQLHGIANAFPIGFPEPLLLV